MRGGELGERDSVPGECSPARQPVQQHPSQTGDDAGHSELLMQGGSSAEDSADGNGSGSGGLDTQQVHGQDLANHALMGGADGIRRLRHPLKRAGV